MPNGWLTLTETAKPWEEEEKERVYEALANLPAALRDLGFQGIYRMKSSYEYPLNPAKGQSRIIALYDPAFSEKANLSRILAHEFAHELIRQSSDEEIESYRMASNWIYVRDTKSGKYRLIPGRDPESYLEADGSESLDEDFSNNIEHFLFNRDVLKLKSRKVHDWLQKRFGDNFKVGR